MITEELLSEVLGRKVEIIEHFGNIIYYEEPNKTVWLEEDINIYELAHKCKEWAKDYEFHSAILDNKASCELFSTSMDEQEFYADTEPEAIFRATQWVYDNKKD
jgi:hypothetical protein